MNDSPISSVRIEKLRRASDQRGYVFEPLADGLLRTQRNVHVVITLPGEIRGNHFHESGTEVTAVSGPTRIRIKERGVLTTYDVPEGETWQLTFPPHVTHAFLNTGVAPSIIISFNTEPHDPENPKTMREIILEP